MLYQRISFFAVLMALVILLGACGTPHPQGLVFKTADPALSLLVPYGETVGSAPADPVAIELEVTEADDQDCNIAGNHGRSGKVYHLPGMAYYNSVRIDLDKGEEWLCSEIEAVEKGYRRSSR